MIGGLVSDVAGFFTISKKTRYDAPTDQFNRILMVKFFMAATLLSGANWFSNEIVCMVPGTAGIAGGYVSEACWINGVYVFKQLKYAENIQGYYGIPESLKENGYSLRKEIRDDGVVNTCDVEKDKNCETMEKVFYLQYQWFPFFLAFLSLMHYLPYLVYLQVNDDIISLERNLDNKDYNKADLLQNYFNSKINNPLRQYISLIMNLLVKVLYLLSNVLAFVFLDSLLNGDFKKYGTKWFEWIGMSNFDMYNYWGIRPHYKVGETLLPTFAMCDVLEVGLDIKHVLYNEHRFICEIKSHVLYQYVLAVVWLALVIGMVVSIIGMFLYIYKRFSSLKLSGYEYDDVRIIKLLPLRQQMYMDLIGQKDLTAYQALMIELKERFTQHTCGKHATPNQYLVN